MKSFNKLTTIKSSKGLHQLQLNSHTKYNEICYGYNDTRISCNGIQQ